MTIRPSTELEQARQLHRAARIEDAVHGAFLRRLSTRGWQVGILAYTGYGAPGWVRVMARVLLGRPDPHPRRRRDNTVVIEAGGRRHEAVTDRGGYLDCVVPANLKPGWDAVRLRVEGADPI